MFDWNNKLSKLLKVYFIKRWRSSFFSQLMSIKTAKLSYFDWLSKFRTDQDFKISIVWQLKNHWWWRQNECKHQWGCCGYFCWCTYKSFLITGVGKWSTWLPADPLGCLGCKLGKSLPFFKILVKEKQI